MRSDVTHSSSAAEFRARLDGFDGRDLTGHPCPSVCSSLSSSLDDKGGFASARSNSPGGIQIFAVRDSVMRNLGASVRHRVELRERRRLTTERPTQPRLNQRARGVGG